MSQTIVPTIQSDLKTVDAIIEGYKAAKANIEQIPKPKFASVLPSLELKSNVPYTSQIFHTAYNNQTPLDITQTIKDTSALIQKQIQTEEQQHQKDLDAEITKVNNEYKRILSSYMQRVHEEDSTLAAKTEQMLQNIEEGSTIFNKMKTMLDVPPYKPEYITPVKVSESAISCKKENPGCNQQFRDALGAELTKFKKNKQLAVQLAADYKKLEKHFNESARNPHFIDYGLARTDELLPFQERKPLIGDDYYDSTTGHVSAETVHTYKMSRVGLPRINPHVVGTIFDGQQQTTIGSYVGSSALSTERDGTFTIHPGSARFALPREFYYTFTLKSPHVIASRPLSTQIESNFSADD